MNAYVVIGLGFGNEGKGSIVEAMVQRHKAGLVVRFNGGPQAFNTVKRPDGKSHVFRQFGSGSFIPGTYTLVSAWALANLSKLDIEAKELEQLGVRDAIHKIYFDERAVVITPLHRAVSWLRETARRDRRIGTSMEGVGETMADAMGQPSAALYMGDLRNAKVLAKKLTGIYERMWRKATNLVGLPDTQEVREQLAVFDRSLADWALDYLKFYQKVHTRVLDPYEVSRLLAAQDNIVFEGAQGVLLDERWGFPPHTTWSTTTARNARLLLEEAEIVERPVVIGVTRSYTTRHGYGPLPTEDVKLGSALKRLDCRSRQGLGRFRYGCLDLPLLQYALKAGGAVDLLAVTHMNAVTEEWPMAHAYDRSVLRKQATLEDQEVMGIELTKAQPIVHRYAAEDVLPCISELLETPVGLTSTGPLYTDKEFHGALAAKPA